CFGVFFALFWALFWALACYAPLTSRMQPTTQSNRSAGGSPRGRDRHGARATTAASLLPAAALAGRQRQCARMAHVAGRHAHTRTPWIRRPGRPGGVSGGTDSREHSAIASP